MNSTTTRPAEQALAITVPAMAKRLGISRGKAYQLAKRKDFPAFELGGRILVSTAGLEEWFAAQLQKKGGE